MRVAIVIGDGHNGLVAGAHLARAGAKTGRARGVRQGRRGGRHRGPWPEAPELKVTRYSYVTSLMPDSATHGGGGACGILACQAVRQLRKDGSRSS